MTETSEETIQQNLEAQHQQDSSDDSKK